MVRETQVPGTNLFCSAVCAAACRRPVGLLDHFHPGGENNDDSAADYLIFFNGAAESVILA
jgi:hypothetical protein